MGRLAMAAALFPVGIFQLRKLRVGGALVVSEQEGWYTDPWGHHDARWISHGVPSKLVRDGQAESYDNPPDSPPAQAWVAIEPPAGSLTGADTRRADEFEAEPTPTLADLNKRQDSAAVTAGAHPWFVARDWVPSSQPTPTTAARKTGRRGLRIAAALLILLSTYLWTVQVIASLTPPPPFWGGVITGALFALAPPLGISWKWRNDRRAGVAPVRRIQRAARAASVLGVISLLLFIATHLAS